MLFISQSNRDDSCHHSRRLHEPVANSKVWDRLLWPMRCWVQPSWFYSPGYACHGINKQTGRKSRHHAWSTAWFGKGVQGLEELPEQGQTRALQHWSLTGKKCGERECRTTSPLRLLTVCWIKWTSVPFRRSLGKISWLQDRAESMCVRVPFGVPWSHLELSLKLELKP